MQKLVALFLFFVCTYSLSAQSLIRCSTMEMDSVLRAKHSLESLQDFENWLQAKVTLYKASPQYRAGSRSVVTIPLIVHIIHNGDAVGSGENLSQAQVNSQFASLNEDFRKMFGTAGYNTNAVGADCEIEFCPAVIDPNGNVLAEPGIDRQNRTQSTWQQGDIDATLKPATIWDPTRYCNIWTVNFGGTSSDLLGYAQFPSSSGLSGLGGGTGSANTDGVVVRASAFGRVGNVTSPYNRGRTTTHELGHWLGLRHIWGDQSCGTDYCDDTPTSTGANYGCPTGQNTCPDAGVDMIQNYMDYTNDACMNIFTLDQKDRVLTVLNNSPRRNSLLSSNVCSIPFTFSYTGRVIDAATNQGIANALVYFDGPADYYPTTDANGYFTISNLQQDNYTVYAGKWGYVTNTLSSILYNPNTAQVTVALQSGYYDDFLLNFGWTTTNTATSGAWVRESPIGTANGSIQSNPGADVTGDYGNLCYTTGNAGGAAGNDDIDAGTVILTSPAMNLTSFANPVLRYYRWFYNSGGSGTPNDSLVISIVNGTQVIDIDKVGQSANSNQWVYKSYRVKDYIPNPGNNIYYRARSFDQSSTGHLVEAGIDLFRVFDSTGTSSQTPVANFASNATSICAGQQVNFNDLSSNNPTSWNWLFPGGSPASANSANPIVTYNIPGTYSVLLTASNNGGTNSTTLNNYITVNPVVAQFSQDTASVCRGQSVTFRDESACNPTSVKWIFNGGDISTSDSATPTVTYFTPGYFDVTLIAINQYGRDTLVRNLAVQVYSPASVSISATSDTDNLAMGTTTVTVSGGATPYSYLWSDPQSQTTQIATGLTAGPYFVTVTDGNGCASINSIFVQNVQVNSIKEVELPLVKISPNPTNDGWILSVDDELVGKDITISDDLGRVVFTARITNKSIYVSAARFSRGIYFLKVSTVTKYYKLMKG